MKNKLFIEESEKSRILEMHREAITKNILNELAFPPPSSANTNKNANAMKKREVLININPKNLGFGSRGNDVKILQQKLMNLGLLKTKTMKPTGYFGEMTKAALLKFNQSNKKTIKQPCQVISPQSDIVGLDKIINNFKTLYPNSNPYTLLNQILNVNSKKYSSQGIPTRTSCEIALIQIRPDYKNKNVIVIDTLNKLLYIFNPKGTFIDKTVIISGKNKQSVVPKVIAKSLMTWDEQVNLLGFKFVIGKGYVDQTGKNRKYDDKLVYDYTDATKTRFLPKGIYNTGYRLGSDKVYAGSKNNVLSLYDGDRKITQAIHGYYLEQPRAEALKKAAEVMSNPNDPKVGEEFMKLLSSGGVNLSQSYGCINVPENFVNILAKYSPNSYVFNMGEDKQNYLVNNTENFLNKMQNSQGCPSPQSLGAIPINDTTAIA